ncbi:hypothetical protein EDB81DRAFT_750911 [Dactylonectria macrodidyma]|uniref:Uncharacterized protein n=1 Tax=Dactylonectria macrodidyma TaxID=307937 RepID=A0A9P9JQI5_9HYPO|nr:hypothetical protein EDB81DRAFT_750911 [Dactylonectria macrodidyma]
MGPEVVNLIKTRSQWPRLENKYLGQVATKCWAREYKDTQELKAGLAEALSAEGWEIEGDDTLRGFNPIGLIPFKEVYGRYNFGGLEDILPKVYQTVSQEKRLCRVP